ncbi:MULTISPECIES: CheR family methyltransferase [Hahella]|uniref:protein-glutamate O-methyltransferase n=1 Tax=Hahella chejuensis (strain KCTC 2396) TaxID=349521 RepID=Q2SPH7_HAHCH|nr:MULTISPECIES: CheR family methyltransferase [Hahella]ABC27447.1 Methylase of chemotaxis methyl-accepting protein [Hahella chejuensis KCTC 2396]AZZ90067.1 protein-glutamate O-methyltransferase CheR [Hahella sp. KA22]MBU6954166.1 protein-glutamate O-methyltransferase CheR [Hahella sp. HN01]QAY53437.1 protein-glutamate O-methyltransferase CheR [Hahella sp. KA22]WLQ12621.1 CheR family methyltransferase [Hahella sp. HNIBRBA332]
MAINDGTEVEGSWSLKTLPPMEDQEFFRWQALLEKRTGMNLPIQRKTFLQTSLGIRMREIGCPSYQEYFHKIVDSPSGVVEWAILVDRLTVQETRFYRDEDAFGLVKDYLLTRPVEALAKSTIEAWSVGCSTGEEPYTLAMIIEECLEALGLAKYYGVTGTDISSPVLEKARTAVYPARKLVTLNEERKEKFFEKRNGNLYAVIPRLKERVCFARVNVLNLKDAPMHGMNIIFCQNLLIYFRRWRRKEILNRLAERLVPGGILVLGLGEIVDWTHPLLQRVGSDKTLAFIRRNERNS